jgi:type VI secretion system protein
MENLSLYDLLVGYFDSETPEPDSEIDYFENMTEDKKLRQSIVENLRLVLQTRQGSVQHLPDFGVPEFMQLYIESRGSIDPIRDAIKDTILKYEPRIERVNVMKSDFDERNMRVSLKIRATIKDNPNREVLFTEFSTTGWTKVVFEKDIS